jgi:hypothetical protein
MERRLYTGVALKIQPPPGLPLHKGEESIDTIDVPKFPLLMKEGLGGG